jgi:hypothetical protein
MKKVVYTFLIVMILSLSLVNVAFAEHGEPAGSCPAPFELHHFMEHSGEHMHVHIGVDQDLNGDGYICMLPVTDTLHLHVDNTLP